MALEQAGVPSVALHTHVFARLAQSVARANGMPRTRQAYVPQPIVDLSPEQLRGYIEGSDPVSRRPFMQEVIEALTRPLDEEDLKGLSFERSTPRLLAPDTEDNLQKLFIDNNWTDFMPVILPTEERVAAMLKGTSHPPDKVVGRLRPTSFREFWELTVEKVAVNAVMAGAKPEYLPVILAHAASGVTARSSSTTSLAMISLVNGPIRNEIGMSSGIGAMGPYNHANVTIGRAYNLFSINGQGGSVPGDTYMGSLGNALNYSATFAEAEERSPWQPFHVQKGFKPTDSTVSIFFGGRYTASGFGPRATWKEKMIRCLTSFDHNQGPLLVLDPIVARLFVDLGFDTKEKLIEWCAQNAQMPARDYWDDQWVQTLTHPLAVAGVEPFASKLKASPDEMVTLFAPHDISIVVAGGETQGAWKMIGGAYRGKATVSVDAWR
ncbi:MAG: UGSC family (seleno)protein [Xanthobacteraceae bacterium]